MRLLFIATFLFCLSSSFAQVNPQNGSGFYQIPIFSFQDPKSGLSHSVGINYSSGNGLIVSSRAGNLGQNWSLLAGGSIYRKQNGEPDDQNSTGAFPIMPTSNFRGFNQEIALYDANYQSQPYAGDPYSRDYIDNYYPNGFMYSEFGVDMVDIIPGQSTGDFNKANMGPREIGMIPRFQSSMDRRYKQSRRSLADREQDVFIYDFNGMTGEFVIGKDGNIELLNDTKLQITKSTTDLTSQNIRTRINEFIIKDIQGVQYKFSAYELTEVMMPEEQASYGIPSFTLKITMGEPKGKYTIQKWLLTEIVNTETLEKIIFTYDQYDIDVVQSQTPTYQNSEGQVAESVEIMVNRSRSKLKRISNISFPDGHSLDFNYNRGFTRPDVPDDKPLYKIMLSYNSQEKYTYTFNYGFFFKKEIKDETTHTFSTVPAADRRYSRLCLTSVRKSGIGIQEPPYKFSYYTGSENTDVNNIVPPFDCLAEDHWGYYTRNTNLDIHVALTKEALKELLTNPNTYRTPSLGTAALGLLKKVEFPLGGSLTFDYEQNYSKSPTQQLVDIVHGGVRVFKTTLNDGVSTAHDIITNYNYTLTDGSSSGWGYEPPNYLVEREVKIWNAGNLNGYTQDGKVRSEILVSASKMGKRVLMNSGDRFLRSAITNSPLDGAFFQVPTPQMVVFNLIMDGFMKRFFTLFNPADYLQTNVYNFNSFEALNPIGVNYSRVEIVNSSVPGGTGKTVQEFVSPPPAPAFRGAIPALTLPYSGKKRFSPWKYGMLSNEKVYNQAGTLLKENAYTFNIIETAINNDNNKSCKVEVLRSHSAGADIHNGSTTITLADFSYQYYYPVKGRSELISAVETNKSLSGLTAQQTTNTTYSADYLPKTISTTRSNGDIVVVKNYNANDYNNISTAIQEMKLRNMLSIPVSTETWLIKPNASEYLVDATINEYFINTNNEVKLNKIYRLETKEPLLKSLIGEQSPTILVRNATYFKEKISMLYDTDGLLKETITPDGNFSTQLYDYNGRFITAIISNAHQTEVAYSSFETNEKGNWTYDILNVTTGESVTGRKYYNFPASSPASISKSWTSTRSGRLSLWAKGGILTASLGANPLTPVKQVPNTATGWTYYEYNFTGSGSVSISNSSTTAALNVDEVRIYPVAARMATTAFDPLRGKTADCDVNNRIRYYEYDGLDRLIYIRDEQKNIIKKLCYNYAGEPETCIDNADTSPQWRDNGMTMCEPCVTNPAYNSGVRLKGQTDLNPFSPTYNQTQWVTDNSGTCTVTPDWYQRTDLAYCEVDGWGGQPTGNYIIPTSDINPCSPTYNQFGTPVVIPNYAACITCNPACNEPQYKCINGVCVQGTWGVIKVFRSGETTWRCTYAYCFPDGSVSSYTQQIISSTPCTNLCP